MKDEEIWKHGKEMIKSRVQGQELPFVYTYVWLCSATSISFNDFRPVARRRWRSKGIANRGCWAKAVGVPRWTMLHKPFI